MIVPNPQWLKKITIGVAQHFKAFANFNGYHFYLHGSYNDNKEYDRIIELRIDGPIINQLSIDYFRLTFGIVVLFSTKIETNVYDNITIAGLISESFSEICVTDLGRLLPKGDLIINDFGIVKGTRVRGGSVESIYEIYLTN